MEARKQFALLGLIYFSFPRVRYLLLGLTGSVSMESLCLFTNVPPPWQHLSAPPSPQHYVTTSIPGQSSGHPDVLLCQVSEGLCPSCVQISTWAEFICRYLGHFVGSSSPEICPSCPSLFAQNSVFFLFSSITMALFLIHHSPVL